MKRQLVRAMAFFLVYLFLFALMGCDSYKQRSYYADSSNYISATGTVSHIAYSKDGKSLYIGFSDLSYKFSDTCFKLVGDNLIIARENGIDEKLKIGSEVSFISAPRYFGDGYVMPIVAIVVQGETLLDFTQGHPNLLKWLEQDK